MRLPVDVGFEVDRCGGGQDPADAGLGVVDGGGDVGSRSAVPMAIFAATRSSSGPRCRVRRWMTRSTPGVEISSVWIAVTSSGRAASPMSRLLVSTARMTAMGDQQDADAQGGDAVEEGVAGEHAQADAGQGEEQAEEAPAYSRRITGSSGLRA
ncbi:hypothetical protein [Micromonospora sp. NPDC049891]|uniref:hypothetical protein n=1 Tax=Micromonospora sp. NPDC049891 TaxID=3155655 RepID=UPI0033E96D7C